MSEEEPRKEAVRRRLAGEGPADIDAVVGRTTRWVRKWVARQGQDSHDDGWAEGRSRAPRSSPPLTDDELRRQEVAARERLVANPRAQYGSLAIQWDLRRVGVDPISPQRTIERIVARAGLSRPRRCQPGYVSQGVPCPALVGVDVGILHQVDLIGPRHLHGGVQSTP